MTDGERRSLVDEVVAALSMPRGVRFDEPVRVEHNFDAFAKTTQRVAAALIMLLLAVIGALLVGAWSMFADNSKDREAFAREVAREMQQAQVERDRNQDGAIQSINTTLVDLRGLIVQLQADSRMRDTRDLDFTERMKRIEDELRGIRHASGPAESELPDAAPIRRPKTAR